jgi:hypothetical protein
LDISSIQKLQLTRRQRYLHWKQGFHQGDYYFGHRSHHGSESNISPVAAKQRGGEAQRIQAHSVIGTLTHTTKVLENIFGTFLKTNLLHRIMYMLDPGSAS